MPTFFKSKKNPDGTLCDGGNKFIIQYTSKGRMITMFAHLDEWDFIEGIELEVANYYY